MRVVLDTNVLVSAFLSPDGAPAQLLTFALAGELTLLFDDRILAEYAEVLRRPRFGLDEADVALVLRQLEADGERIDPTRSTLDLPDESDRPFLDVAVTGAADALITGNTRGTHCATSDTAGSTRTARRAGITHAPTPTVASITARPAYVSGSVALTP